MSIEDQPLPDNVAQLFKKPPESTAHLPMSLQLHPNPESSLEDQVATALRVSAKLGIPVWYDMGLIRVVIRTPYKTVNQYVATIHTAFQDIQDRQAEMMKHQHPTTTPPSSIVLDGNLPLNPLPIITDIPSGSPFHKPS